MKAFLLISAAWLSGAGGDPTPLPVPLPAGGAQAIATPGPVALPPAPVVGAAPAPVYSGPSPVIGAAPVYSGAAPVIGSPVLGQAPAGPCCGNQAAPTHSAPAYSGVQVYSGAPAVVSGSSCACDTCATARATGGPSAPGLAPASAPAAAGASGHGHHKGHLFHRLFGKGGSTAAAAPVSSPVSASSPAASSACGCPSTPVTGGSCGCGPVSAPAAAPAPSGGFFSRLFGSAPAPAPAPIYAGSVGTGCSNCGQAPIHTGYPTTGVIQGAPSYPSTGVIQNAPSYPTTGVIQGAPGHLPSVGYPIQGQPLPGTVITPGTPTPTPTPLPAGPTGPEGIKEAPKEPMKLPAVPDKGLQPTSGTQIESGGRRPFEDHHRQQAQLGSAADFSSVTGKLAFVHVDGGLWVLRYAPLDREDRNGGSVILGKDRRLESYREGDVVTVKGQLTEEKASTRLAAPLYRVNSIQLVDRPAK